jgi:drug/metabolite transporter (DMT)-like permease
MNRRMPSVAEAAPEANATGVTPAGPRSRPAVTTARLVAAFAAIYLIWGSTYLAIRFGIEGFPPLLLAGARHVIAGIVLFPVARYRSGGRPTARNWRAAALVGILLLLFGNGAVCWSEQTVPSGVAAILVATVSLWMVIVEWLRPGGARPSGRVFAGLALGFSGLIFLVGPSHFGGGGRVNPIGATVLALGALAWATGSVFSKHIELPRSPLLGTAMQSLVGGVALLIAAFLSGEMSAFDAHRVSLRSALALVYLIVFGSWIGFTAYTYLLGVAPPGRVGTYAYVNPVVAMFLGWAFAGEPVTLRTFSAAAVILTAVVLVITAPHRTPNEPEPIPAPGEA